MKKPKILLTAFEPFGELEENLSLSTLTRFENRSPRSLRIEKVVIPTSYSRSAKLIAEVLENEKPEGVLSLGVALASPSLRIERFALNIDDSDKPDNDGQVLKDTPIIEGAPWAYRATGDVEKINTLLISEEIPSLVSNHAGTYVCNHLFYLTLHKIYESALSTRAVFIHLPLSASEAIRKEARSPFITLDMALKAAELALEALLQET